MDRRCEGGAAAADPAGARSLYASPLRSGPALLVVVVVTGGCEGPAPAGKEGLLTSPAVERGDSGWLGDSGRP